LKSINIPHYITKIGTENGPGGSFSNCISLTSIVLPNTITYIAPKTFLNCKLLNSITLPTNINYTSISNELFYQCSSLNSIIIPSNIISIGSKAFAECKLLSSITLTNNITTIQKNFIENNKEFTNIIINNASSYIRIIINEINNKLDIYGLIKSINLTILGARPEISLNTFYNGDVLIWFYEYWD
jgi:hypothetical protein